MAGCSPWRVARRAPGRRAGRRDPARAGDGACGVLFDGVLHDRAELEVLRARWGPSGPQLVLDAYRRWGEGALERLRGRFAVVFWDGERDLVLCARDPLGVVPLVLGGGRRELHLSSSFAALRPTAAVSSELNRVVVADHVCLRWRDPEETL